MIRKLVVLLLLGLFYLFLDMVQTRPIVVEEVVEPVGSSRPAPFKRGSELAQLLGKQLRAAKAAKHDAQSCHAPVVANRPSVSPHLVVDIPQVFARTGSYFGATLLLIRCEDVETVQCVHTF